MATCFVVVTYDGYGLCTKSVDEQLPTYGLNTYGLDTYGLATAWTPMAWIFSMWFSDVLRVVF